MNELDSVRFMHPSMSYSLIGHQQNEHGNKNLVAPFEKVSEHAKRLFADPHPSWWALDLAGIGSQEGCAF